MSIKHILPFSDCASLAMANFPKPSGLSKPAYVKLVKSLATEIYHSSGRAPIRHRYTSSKKERALGQICTATGHARSCHVSAVLGTALASLRSAQDALCIAASLLSKSHNKAHAPIVRDPRTAACARCSDAPARSVTKKPRSLKQKSALNKASRQHSVKGDCS